MPFVVSRVKPLKVPSSQRACTSIVKPDGGSAANFTRRTSFGTSSPPFRESKASEPGTALSGSHALHSPRVGKDSTEALALVINILFQDSTE